MTITMSFTHRALHTMSYNLPPIGFRAGAFNPTEGYRLSVSPTPAQGLVQNHATCHADLDVLRKAR